MNQAWRIEHACPQCGAPVLLDESDRLFSCPYCRVNYYMFAQEAHRYHLPPPRPVEMEKLFYAPYWRFKGVIYSCLPFKVADQILDATVLSADVKALPQSLGLRPQVLKMKFLLPKTPGRFVAPDIAFDTALALMEQRLKVLGKFGKSNQPFHRTFFGETVSLIYAPYYIENGGVYDAILGRFLGRWPGPASGPRTASASEVGLEVRFVPALCPHCGWDLAGDKNSLVLVCSNCRNASEASARGLTNVKYRVVAGDGHESAYLPFWRIKARTQGLSLNYYADLIRVLNLPKAIMDEWRRRPLYFWFPAFKVHAQLYLRLARNMTVAQPSIDSVASAPSKPFLAVTLPAREAAEALKISLAKMSMSKRSLYPQLPDVTMSLKEALLVFFPFHSLGQDFTNQDMQISVSRALLGFQE